MLKVPRLLRAVILMLVLALAPVAVLVVLKLGIMRDEVTKIHTVHFFCVMSCCYKDLFDVCNP